MASSIISFDTTSLLNYYNAKINVANTASQRNAASAATSSSASSTAATPPWQTATTQTQQAHDAQVLSLTSFFSSDPTQLSVSGSDAKSQQDNQNLFNLYQAVNQLSYLSSMSQRDSMTAGQLAGYNTRFQSGLDEVQNFLQTTTFNNLTLQAANPSSSVTGTASVPFSAFDYTGATIVSDAKVTSPLPGVSAADSFTVAVKKGNTTTNVPIDLSNVQGGLTTDHILAYVNQQLQAGGFTTRFTRTMTSGTSDDPTDASYGIQIAPGSGETVSLSAASTPALYLTGNSGTATATDDTAADQTGRIIKLDGLGATSGSDFSKNIAADSGTTTAQDSAMDADGNLYVLGNTTGSVGSQLNQGSQDVYLTKYDSAGKQLWTQLVGSAGTASGYSLATDPTGGVVIAGTSDASLSADAVGDGNDDAFAAKYDANGNQTWETQIPTFSDNQGYAVSVDASGNVYLGGQTSGTLGTGNTSAGGTDAYVAKLDAKGNIAYEQQMGTSGTDQVSQMATTADGSLVVASVQNGHAILSKYTGGDATTAPAWQVDLGALGTGGSLGGLTVSGNQIYLSGTTSNAALTAGGAATVASASSGNTDAFVFSLADGGASATPEKISYVGTSGTDKGGAVTVGADGTVYLTGTTRGTFAGQTRNVAGTDNMFVSALNADGTVSWSRQFGGADGQSTGTGIAIDPNGSSVLDALGLPHGTINLNQSTDLSTATTLRAGDSFEIDVGGTAPRKIAITIDPGETMRSLATKISASLSFAGTATVAFANGGEALQISLKPGATATLVSGPADSDALGRLGIAPGTLTNSKGTTASSTANNVFGLGLTGTLDISSKTSAGGTHATLQNVLSAIKNAYTTVNTPPSTGSSVPAATGPVPAYLQSQITSYSLALALFS
ncbi:MAG TPA: SBBP repeat-containing protein [Rhizomicrobium sp.]|jgi:hypothetical protein|nr:SBBP repeat-containing protein [Rhizomicrobium sp.]